MKTRKILHAKITGIKMIKRNHYRMGKRRTYVEQLIQETGKTNIKTITLKSKKDQKIKPHSNTISNHHFLSQYGRPNHAKRRKERIKKKLMPKEHTKKTYTGH